MNAEQKAFYEYGKAFERMNSTKKRLRGIWHSDKCIRTRIGQAAIIGPRHKRNVKDAWQKRAACRAWKLLAQRHCLNCLYRENPANAAPCADCTLGDLTEDSWLVCNWKPRKEASND